MLHSNLCSLADCNKHLWQPYTHTTATVDYQIRAMYKFFKKCSTFLCVFGNSHFREVCVSSHAPQVCCWTCDTATITDTVHYSPAEVTSCVFVRHLRWTWFEFSCLCIFSCHDSHKHLHERCGFGLWICCLMGELPYIWHTDAFRFDIYEALCLLIMCLFLSKRERLPPVPNTVCLSVGHLSEGVCINAVICQWHGLETLSRSVLPKI